MDNCLVKILLMLVTFFALSNVYAQPKSYFREYCPSHRDDFYCQKFEEALSYGPEKIKCCADLSENQRISEEYTPNWINRTFGYPLELFDRCMLGPYGGVVLCE